VHVDEVTASVLNGRAELSLLPPSPDQSALEWHVLVAEAIRRGDAAEAERATKLIVLQSAAEAD
jgi:hypothetical protein